MAKEAYVTKNFRRSSLEQIDRANGIIAEYQAGGYVLTLRQLYYQFVARGHLGNTEKNYKALGALLDDARMAGLIDWGAIVDRTRHVRELAHYDDPADVIKAAAASYHLDWWEEQDNYVEVWIEKDALVDVALKAAQRWDVPCFSSRGYASQSAMYMAAQRFKAQDWRMGRYIVYLGDHDPSGIDMTRDVRERLATFGADVEVRRAALNMDQVQAYSPPPNPAKVTDSRAMGYIQQYGAQSWELDALEPQELEGIIDNAVSELADIDGINEAIHTEAEQKLGLGRLSVAVQFHGFDEAVDAIRGRFGDS